NRTTSDLFSRRRAASRVARVVSARTINFKLVGEGISMKPKKSQSKSYNYLWSLFLATRTRRFTTIAVAIIATCTIALATLSLAQTEKRIQRGTSSTAKPASRITKPEKNASSRDSDRFKRRLGKFRNQEGSGLGNQDETRRERNRDRGPREWKLRRARPFTGDLRHLPQARPIKAERP